VKLEPRNAEFLISRGRVRAACPSADVRDGAKAVADAEAACKLSKWANPQHLEVLAAACAEAGKFDDAVKWQKKALENATYLLARGLAGQHFLKLYEQQQPYRDPLPAGKGCGE